MWSTTADWAANKTRSILLFIVGGFGNIFIILSLLTQTGITPTWYLLPSVILTTPLAFATHGLVMFYMTGRGKELPELNEKEDQNLAVKKKFYN